MTSPLPVSARLAWWGTSWLRGLTSPDDLLDAVLGDDVAHTVGGLDGLGDGTGDVSGDGSGRTWSLLETLAELRRRGATGLGAAFPVEGDLVGLGGPPALNLAAAEAGEAVVAPEAGVGLVPWPVGPSVQWQAYPGTRRQLPDVGEADRELRRSLLEVADRLAALEVARWRPEVADALIDLRHREGVAAPPGVPPRCVELAARGRQALQITDLALEDDGGAVTAYEMQERRDALLPLARAGRRALVAACSPEVWPPD